jgi:SAM-dependent methyltransferase
MIHNNFYKLAGLLFLVRTKVKSQLRGYATPRPFPISEIDRAIDYDFAVVDKWLASLERYAGSSVMLHGKQVLELGPGADLGAGLYLLARGVASYNALDVNNLVESVPPAFYQRLFERLAERLPEIDITQLREQLLLTQQKRNERLNYVCRGDFDIAAAFPAHSIDLIFSQAAFEHFDDVAATIKQLSAVAKPGAILVAEVDLMTHSRWIREKDPNNIYRYSEALYKLFSFRGSPNRVRPYQYEQFLRANGWHDIRIFPDQTLPEDKLRTTRLNAHFEHERNQMDILTFIVCATKD